MGCMQVRVEPNRLENPVKSNKSKSTNSQVEYIQNGPRQFERSMTVSMTMHSTQVTMIESLMTTTSGIMLKPGDLTQQSTTLVQSFNSSDYHDTGINETFNEFDAAIASQKTLPDLKGTRNTQDNVLQAIDMDSNVSDIPEVSSMSITSSELDQLSSIHSSDASPSIGVDHKKQRRNAIHEFLLKRPKRSKTRRIPRCNNVWSESEESYSLRDNFVTSISAGSEKVESDRAKNIQTTLVWPKKSRVQHRIFANQPCSESNGSVPHQVSETKSPLKNAKPQFVSTRLSNPNGHPKGFLTKTRK